MRRATVAGVLVADGANLYWIDDTLNAVTEMPIGGGAVTTLASGLLSWFGGSLGVDARNVYFTSPAAGTITQVPIGGGTLVTVASGQDPYGVAVNPTSVFWTVVGPPGSVDSAPK